MRKSTTLIEYKRRSIRWNTPTPPLNYLSTLLTRKSLRSHSREIPDNPIRAEYRQLHEDQRFTLKQLKYAPRYGARFVKMFESNPYGQT